MSQALNVVAFVPCGALAVALGLPATTAIGVGAGISMTTEVLQLFSRRRYPSVTDLILNTAGTALGALALARQARRAQP